MKGIVFNLLEEVVTVAHGEDAWDGLLDATGLDGVWTSLGNYPDGDLLSLVGAASQTLGQEPDAIVRWFGREALPLLAVRYPDFFTPHTQTIPFLLTLNDIIHPEVLKLYPGAQVPSFTYATADDGALLMSYASPRALCAFGEGLIEGAARHYGQDIELDQPECVKRGDAQCLIRVTTR